MAESQEKSLPALNGIRVLDIATFLAAPFCGTIMADFGAEVIKIEQPDGGDPLRRFGTPAIDGDTFVWLSEARNKRFITLDLRTDQGKAAFLKLVAISDVVLENFRPGTLERWGLGFDVLQAVNPRIVLLRVSAYGQTGPYREKPGFARVAHGFSGLANLAGSEDGPPVVPGSTSLADYTAGMWGALGVMMALRVAEKTGLGQVVDVSLYEAIFRLLDEIAPVYARFGEVRKRMGADVPHVVPHGHWQTSEGKWVALACSSDKIFERLANAMQRRDLVEPGTFETNARRLAGRGTINAAIAEWIGGMRQEEALRLCDEAGVPCGPIMAIDDIFNDPQYKARGNLRHVDDDRAGEVVVPDSIPLLSQTPAVFQHLGKALGADTDTILQQLLEMDADMIQSLRASNAI